MFWVETYLTHLSVHPNSHHFPWSSVCPCILIPIIVPSSSIPSLSPVTVLDAPNSTSSPPVPGCIPHRILSPTRMKGDLDSYPAVKLPPEISSLPRSVLSSPLTGILSLAIREWGGVFPYPAWRFWGLKPGPSACQGSRSFSALNTLTCAPHSLDLWLGGRSGGGLEEGNCFLMPTEK